MTAASPSLLERTSSRRPTWTIAGLLAASVFAVAQQANALPEFPGIVQETLDLDCAPPCLICHLMPAPQLGASADQAFALNLKAAAGSLTEANLGATLTFVEANGCLRMEDFACVGMTPCGVCDADGDGQGDILEVRASQNPNNTGDLPCPKYGCGAHVAPERTSRRLDGSAALAVLCVLGVFVRRFRRR